MKRRVIHVVLVGTIGPMSAFWLYGLGRTMRETVNFHPDAAICGLLLGVVGPLLTLTVALLIGHVCFGLELRQSRPLAIAFIVSLLVGSLVSEAQILADEVSFSGEVIAAGSTTVYSRPRCWPNRGSSLVFVPGRGIHGTD
jgi:hypothetical protein